MKEYDKGIFYISEHFIKVEIPFSLPGDNIIIANGNEIGNGNLEMMKALKLIISRKCIYYSKANGYKYEKGKPSYKSIKRKWKNYQNRI